MPRCTLLHHTQLSARADRALLARFLKKLLPPPGFKDGIVVCVANAILLTDASFVHRLLGALKDAGFVMTVRVVPASVLACMPIWRYLTGQRVMVVECDVYGQLVLEVLENSPMSCCIVFWWASSDRLIDERSVVAELHTAGYPARLAQHPAVMLREVHLLTGAVILPGYCRMLWRAWNRFATHLSQCVATFGPVTIITSCRSRLLLAWLRSVLSFAAPSCPIQGCDSAAAGGVIFGAAPVRVGLLALPDAQASAQARSAPDSDVQYTHGDDADGKDAHGEDTDAGNHEDDIDDTDDTDAKAGMSVKADINLIASVCKERKDVAGVPTTPPHATHDVTLTDVCKAFERLDIIALPQVDTHVRRRVSLDC
jgi:hypothetical protein